MHVFIRIHQVKIVYAPMISLKNASYFSAIHLFVINLSKINISMQGIFCLKGGFNGKIGHSRPGTTFFGQKCVCRFQ